MRSPSWSVLVFLVALAACDSTATGPPAPLDVLPTVPLFLIQPGGAAQDTSCEAGVAFLRNDTHLTSLAVEFFPPGGSTARTRCGALPFDESPDTAGRVQMRQSVRASIFGHWETWGRRLRDAYDGDAPETFFGRRQVEGVDTAVAFADTFDIEAPAHD